MLSQRAMFCTCQLRGIIRNFAWKASAAIINEEIPRITVPSKMVQKINKKLAHQARQQVLHGGRHVFKSPLIIACKRKTFNHHKGQTYPKLEPITLASKAWKHRKSAGDHFTILNHRSNPALQGHEYETFTELGLDDTLIKGLQETMNITVPTNIQKLLIPKLLEGKNVLSAAETGSGKTLAYLLPIFQLLQRQNAKFGPGMYKNAPKFLILAPSKELVEQIMGVIKRLSDVFPLTAFTVTGGSSLKTLGFRSKPQNIDILIGTPGATMRLIINRAIRKQQLQMVVLDEADTLMDDSFSSQVRSILRMLDFQPGDSTGDLDIVTSATQVLFTGATVPRSLEEIIGDLVPPDCLETVMTNNIHRLMPHVPQKFLRLKPSCKHEELFKLAKYSQDKNIETMIFCNKTETAFWVHGFLKDNGIGSIPMFGSMEAEERDGAFQRFQEQECNILVATDICSRGLDTVNVKRVINYEFPTFMSDYIHRAGRVGRVGTTFTGQVISFITKPYEVELLWHVEEAARGDDKVLHNVNANIRRKLVSLTNNKESFINET